MAFHRKFAPILALRPDVAVISECACPARLLEQGLDWAEGAIWTGENPAKGLAIFGFGDVQAALMAEHDPRLRHILPVALSGPLDCDLWGVWAQNASGGNTRKHQLGPLRRAVARHKARLARRPTVMAGDFNNNIFWDKPGWRMNHAAMVKKLKALGLTSAYHDHLGEAQGAESQPTLYWRDRTRNGPTYHIDYIFRPEDWTTGSERLTVGGFDDWVGNGLSDHVPLIWDITLPGQSP